MNILAIIPARKGSKGIPNKNIRLINSRPLVYYSINNAINSKLITDIIVTSDSDEVEIIAKQMGVNFKRRDPKLADDAVTLDSVVYDAIPMEKEWDYVVTLQPTSPTLKSSTLDSAIEYAIDNDFDTVISGINKPHLTWKEENGKKIPNYDKRLNRQYLPALYFETGAFVISKASIISSDSRIGNNVEIYEISPEESYDIDNYYDIQIASEILKNDRVAIYVNGNNVRGIGHIYRALEIADEFFTKVDIYYDSNQTQREIFGETTHSLIAVNGIPELYDLCKKKQYTIFINDILSTSIDYMIGLRSVLPEAKIINFEDDGEGALKADVVINALYEDSNAKNVYAGEKYYISGKSFMFYNPIEIKERVKNIFISFGGSDPKNYTDRLLKIISDNKYSNYNFTVVLGRAKKNVDELFEYNKFDNINVKHDVSNMPELMVNSDIGITSRGRTAYELALLGIPSISMSQNEREEKHTFISNENGFTYIGLNPSDEIIEGNLDIYIKSSRDTREKFHNKLLSHDLRNGRKRVMGLINNL